MAIKVIPVATRFWSFVDKSRGRGPWKNCWTWTGSRSKDGYGRLAVNDGPVLAHRLAWFLAYGVWPTPQALHECDTPACVRLSHLFEGTQADNMHDAIRKQRWNPSLPGSANGFSRLTEFSVQLIKHAPKNRTDEELAIEFDVHPVTIGGIRAGKSWKHIR